MNTGSFFLNAKIAPVAAVMALVASLAGHRVCAQTNFGLSLSAAPNPVLLNQPVTYTITVTNLNVFEATDVLVSNRFSSPVVFVAMTNSIVGTLTTNADTMIFRMDTFPGGQVLFLTLLVAAGTPGALTNSLSVSALATAPEITNVTTQVIAGQPDLGITIGGPGMPVLVNDWMTYQLTVRNQGSDAAANVVVSNNLPASARLIGFGPSNQVVTASSNHLIWSPGTLPGGGITSLQVTVQPTNTGVFTNSAAVSAPDVLDTNTVNNSTSTNIFVGPLLAGGLVASNVTAMQFNPQTGLLEQTVRLVNSGTGAVAAARIIVSGLTNRLFNAVGTNDGNPFVVYGAALETNQSADLLLEYFVPTRLPIVVADSQLHPYGSPAFSSALPGGTAFNITLVTNLPSGSIMIEFQSAAGRSYTVLYSDNSSFTNALAAQPPIVAPADRTQWIDDGPPKTISRPASLSARFYRVMQN